MNDTTTSQITHIVADALEVTPQEAARFGELENVDGWDSLKRLNVLMAIEETTGVAMEPDDLPEMTSVERIAELVDARRSG